MDNDRTMEDIVKYAERLKEEHIKIHKVLHKNLSDLVCDMLKLTDMLPNESTILELMEWSHKQTTDPDELS